MTTMNDLKLGTQVRVATFDRASINKDARTVELSFSSEAAEVPRWYGREVLGHNSNECDLSFLASGRAPLLVDHNRREQIGVVESARITDRTGRAVVRFGKSARAEQEFQDVMDGIRSNISCGYEVKEMLLVKAGADESTYRATKWRPFEISLLALPADENVGIGRERDQKDGSPVPIINPNPTEETRAMNATVQTQAPVADQAAIAEASRVAVEAARAGEKTRRTEIMAIGTRHNMRDFAEKHVDDGTSLELFRGLMLDKLAERGSDKPLQVSQAEIGLTPKQAKSFSFVRAIAGASARRAGEKPIVDDAFERECAAAVAKNLGRDARGMFIPTDAMMVSPLVGSDMKPEELQRAMALYRGMQGQRDLLVGTPTAGGNLVATNLLAASFIELLRNAMQVRAMGATVLNGLVGNVAIPKHTGAGTAAWVGENAAPAETALTVGQVPLSPKTISAFTDYSRLLTLQATPAIEQLVRNDLALIIALGIDLAAIHGTGAGNQPTGLALQAGIGSVAGGANGAAPTWDHIVDLETAVGNANAGFGTLGYLTNTKVRGKLKRTQKFASTNGDPIWAVDAGLSPGGVGVINGSPAGVSNQVRSDLVKGASGAVCSAIFFGNWADLLIGEWGVLDMLVNPYTGADAGTVRVHVFQTVDVAVRNAVSFAAMLDALTV